MLTLFPTQQRPKKDGDVKMLIHTWESNEGAEETKTHLSFLLRSQLTGQIYLFRKGLFPKVLNTEKSKVSHRNSQ